jgi:CheY-like chemotaxis protein
VSESEADVSSERGRPRPLALVADDEPAMRTLVGEVLAEVGFDTLLAANGQELLDLAAQHRPQLIVADVMMPGMDGYTAVARLRRQPEAAEMPIIMLTASADPAHRQVSEGLGAYAHLTKPFSPVLLGELAREMVRRSSR